MELYIERGVDKDLKDLLAKGAWVEIVGPQRIGKTMMARRLVKEVRETGRRAAYCDADRDFRFASDDELPQEVANVIAPAMGVETPEVAKPEPAARDSSADTLVLAKLSARIKAVLEALVKGAEKRVLLVVDELGKLRPGFRDAFVSAFLALKPEQVQLVLLGNELTATYSSPLAKRLELLWLPDFTPTEAAKAVAFELNEAPAAAAPWNDEALVQTVADGIYTWTRGHAQLTRYWSRKLRAQGKDAYSPESLKALADQEEDSRLFVRARAWIEESRAVEEIDALLVYWQLLHGQRVPYDEQIAGHRLLRRTGLGAVDEGSMRLRSAIFEKALTGAWVEERLRTRDVPDVLLDGQLLVWLKNERKAGDLPYRTTLRRVAEWAKANAASPLLSAEALRAFVGACRRLERRRRRLWVGVPLAAAFVLLATWTVNIQRENDRLANTQLTEPELRDRANELISFAREFREDDGDPAREQFYQNVEEITERLLGTWRRTQRERDDLAGQLQEVRLELDALQEGERNAPLARENSRRQMHSVLRALGYQDEPPDDPFATTEALARTRMQERDFARDKVEQILDELGYSGGRSRAYRFNEAVTLVENATRERDAANAAIRGALRELGYSGTAAGAERGRALVTLAQDRAQALSSAQADLTTLTRERDDARAEVSTRTQERDDAENAINETLRALGYSGSGTRSQRHRAVVQQASELTAIDQALQQLGVNGSGSRQQQFQELLTRTRTQERDAANAAIREALEPLGYRVDSPPNQKLADLASALTTSLSRINGFLNRTGAGRSPNIVDAIRRLVDLMPG